MLSPKTAQSLAFISVLRKGLNAMEEAIVEGDVDYVWSYYRSVEEMMQETLAALNGLLNEATADAYASPAS